MQLNIDLFKKATGKLHRTDAHNGYMLHQPKENN